MSVSRSPSISWQCMWNITNPFTSGIIVQQRILDLSSRLLINGNEMINNYLDKWKFMRILMDIHSPNTMLCWTAITVLFVWHTDRQFVITWFYSTSCGVFTISKISLFERARKFTSLDPGFPILYT